MKQCMRFSHFQKCLTLLTYFTDICSVCIIFHERVPDSSQCLVSKRPGFDPGREGC